MRSIALDKDNNVLGGNQVLQAAVNAGMIRVRIIDTNGQEIVAVRRTDVSIDTAEGRELALADNLIPLRSRDLDADVIQRQAADYGIRLEGIGLSADELAIMLQEAAKAEADAGGGEPTDFGGGGDEPPADQGSQERRERYPAVEVECNSELHQAELMQRYTEQGLRCRAVTRTRRDADA
ncbi:MAG TPA: hypothetical protein VK324_04470 [Tepidisphaeraceae bacterium]|nr:hypothetical protein [Tepidisphaeraceae bacterium]